MLFHPFPFSNVEHVTATPPRIPPKVPAIKPSIKTSGLKRLGSDVDLSVKSPRDIKLGEVYSQQPGISRRQSYGSVTRESLLSKKPPSTPEVTPTKATPTSSKTAVAESPTSSKSLVAKEIETPTIKNANETLKKADPDSIEGKTSIDDLSPELKQAMKDQETLKDTLNKVSSPELKADLNKKIKDLETEIEKMKLPNEKLTFKKAWENTGDFLKKNAGIIGVTALSATALGLIIKSEINKNRINNTDYKIQSITSSDTTVTITYEPKDRFSLKDSVTISNSNSTPTIDGSYQLIYSGNGIIRIKGKKITTQGTSGELRCFTSFENQFSQSVSDITKPVAQAAGGIIGDVLGTGLGSVFEGLIPQGVQDFFSQFWILILICCILLSLSSSFVAIASFAK